MASGSKIVPHTFASGLQDNETESEFEEILLANVLRSDLHSIDKGVT
jgi:hypothetical protein